MADESAGMPQRDQGVSDHLAEENRQLAQRYLELESTTRRQLEKLREANSALAKGEANMRLLLEDADIGFALLDLKGKVISANQTLSALVGYQQMELPGENFTSLVYVGSLQTFSRMIGGVAGRGRSHEVIELVARDGTLVHCRLAVSPWMGESGALQGSFILAFSVEEERHIAARLHQMEEAVAEAEKSRKLFLDVISRELRSPASSIMGMIRMMMDANLSERQAELAGVIHSSASAIVTLVDDMVDIVGLEPSNHPLILTPLKPVDLVRGTANFFTVRAEEKGLEIKVDIGPTVPEWILGDAVRIRRVLAHLLDNAVKFTEKGHITLSVDVLNDNVRFMVSDTGPGLQSDPAYDLFADIQTEPAPDARRHGGAGIGLPISRRLVALMGGKIGYESEPGRGSEFHFTIPLQSPESVDEEQIQPPPEAIRLNPMHILLADGNPLSQRVVKAYLQFDGHELTIANSGLEAAEQCRFNAFDVVLLDINLPKLDGLQTLRLIRDDEKATGRQRTPILLFASTGRLKDAAFYRREGADGILKKPIQPVDLMAAISRATGSEPVSVARQPAPGMYEARSSGSTLRRIDGTQLVNLRQVMLDDQFMGILRFFMEDAVPGIIALAEAAEGSDPDRERIAFSASKSRGMAGYLGFSALAELLTKIENAGRTGAPVTELRKLTRELPQVTDDSLEELKRVLPETFATISAMTGPILETGED